MRRHALATLAILLLMSLTAAPALGMPLESERLPAPSTAPAAAAQAPAEPAPAAPPALRMGMDMPSAAELEARGAPADLGAIWVGAWMQTSGWEHVDALLDEANARGVTPVIHFWYWGDSIAPDCVANGCYDALHDEHLSQEGWRAVADQLAARLADKRAGAESIVILESEFNKHGIETEAFAPTFDALLAAQATRLREGAPGTRVALGFGAWGEEAWPRFPQAVAASDLLSFQMMRGSTRDDLSSYSGVAWHALHVAQALAAQFGKPLLLGDLALSSHPSASHEAAQAEALSALLARSAELQAAGVEGIVYRAVRDDPAMDPANYFGIAEQHWGFVRADGTAKPALDAWIAAAKAAG